MNERGREFVEKNRAGMISGFVKAIRMKKWKHAVYYGGLLLLGGQSTWYVSRRVVISAAEDSLDPNVMRYASEMHLKKTKDKDFVSVLLGAVAICQGTTWWDTEYGRKSIIAMFKEKKYPEPEEEKQSELIKLIEDLIKEGGWESFVKSTKAVVKLTNEKREIGRASCRERV